MSKLIKSLMVVIATTGAATALPASAGADAALTCSVSVQHVVNRVTTLSYEKEFTVNPNAPFSDDFSTALRVRTFDASMTRVSGLATVEIDFFADVSVFNSVDFRTKLNVRNDRDGETTSGSHTLFTSAGANSTDYTLTCRRAN